CASQTAELSKEVAVSTETLQMSRCEIGDIKRTLQTLEIINCRLRAKAALEGTLAETSSRHVTILAGYQRQVEALEEQLTQLRADLENQRLQYTNLLDLNTRLELEIKEYRRLLDGESERCVHSDL
uniref:keratin, type I cytoskeletal 13-like n=1 Tax=Monopterus albus TaxID=43700 RepID=UPI0009B4C717